MNREDSKVGRELRRNLAEFELELLTLIRQTVKDGKTPDPDLVSLLAKIADLSLVKTYTHRFEAAILKNPSLMIPPGLMQGSLAQKFKGLQVSVQRQERRDKREGKNKKLSGSTGWTDPVTGESLTG